MIDPVDKMVLLGELGSTICKLNHEDDKPRRACDYIICPMGTKDGDITEIVNDFATIPVCEECMAAIQGDEWILFYCLSCGSSQWILRDLSRKPYSKSEVIIWMPECPKCIG